MVTFGAHPTADGLPMRSLRRKIPSLNQRKVDYFRSTYEDEVNGINGRFCDLSLIARGKCYFSLPFFHDSPRACSLMKRRNARETRMRIKIKFQVRRAESPFPSGSVWSAFEKYFHFLPPGALNIQAPRERVEHDGASASLYQLCNVPFSLQKEIRVTARQQTDDRER